MTRRRPERDFCLSMIGATGGALLAATGIAALARAWTWVQLGLAGFGVSVSVAIAVVLAFRSAPTPRLRRAAIALAVVGCARLVMAVAPGGGGGGGLVQDRFLDGVERRFWFAGLPERETVALGAWVGLSSREHREGAAAILDLYRDATRPSSLLDSWFFERGHYAIAVPEGKGPFPLIVFVHGNGGNFLAFQELVAPAAVARGFAIAFPTNGFGNWGGRDALDRITRTVEHAARDLPIDSSRVALIGLSAGVPGVLDAAELAPTRWRCVVGISGPWDDKTLRGSRVLLVHGPTDERCPVRPVREGVAKLRAAGVEIELREQPGAGHLLLATHRERWVPEVLGWVGERVR